MSDNILVANVYDAAGSSIVLCGMSIENLAERLAEFQEPALRAAVYDAHGFVRGWIYGDGSWRTT